MEKTAVKSKRKISDRLCHMSSGKLKVHRGFNKTVIKDGWIVKLRKDGTIKAKIEPYPRTSPKK